MVITLTKAAALPELVKKEVIKHRADYGISLDGDGDRVILVDEKGNILDGDDLLYILAFSNPNRTGPWSGVVGTLMSNLGLENGIKKLGYKFKRADVGCLLYTSPSPRD